MLRLSQLEGKKGTYLLVDNYQIYRTSLNKLENTLCAPSFPSSFFYLLSSSSFLFSLPSSSSFLCRRTPPAISPFSFFLKKIYSLPSFLALPLIPLPFNSQSAKIKGWQFPPPPTIITLPFFLNLFINHYPLTVTLYFTFSLFYILFTSIFSFYYIRS